MQIVVSRPMVVRPFTFKSRSIKKRDRLTTLSQISSCRSRVITAADGNASGELWSGTVLLVDDANAAYVPLDHRS